jgi:hypothetical protein
MFAEGSGPNGLPSNSLGCLFHIVDRPRGLGCRPDCLLHMLLMLDGVPPTIHQPTRAVFRLPHVALIAVVLLAVCATPVAFAAPWLWLIYLVPVGLAWWVLRLRTEADARGIRVRRMFTSRRLSWDEVAGLRLRESGWVRAVLRDGDQVTLPNVRTGDVPALALVSDGRLADPRGGPTIAA